MIINHKYQFIFLKTHKTANTSLEIALSKFCGSKDVITYILDKDENIRKELGYPTWENDKIPFKYYRFRNGYDLVAKSYAMKYKNHMLAVDIRRTISPEIWNNNYKFSIERNPFDKAVSRYYWSTSKDSRSSFENFLENAGIHHLTNWDVYTINDHVVTDRILKYENIESELQELRKVLNLPDDIIMPRSKTGHRKNNEHYSHIYTEKAKQRVALVCAKELATLDYGWESI